MARGWESKSIEAQQEEAVRSRAPNRTTTPAELGNVERTRVLELARRRALEDLKRASIPAHRQMLEHAIAALDEQLAALTRQA